MKKLALILTLLASASAWAQGDAEAGKAKANTCAACHGADGNSILPDYPNLAGQHANYIEKQLKEFKLGAQSGGEQGRYNAVMAGMVAPLSEQDMADLAAYYATLTPKPGTTPEGSVAIGRQLYMAGDPERGIAACTACHGPRGNGTPSSGFPKISGQPAKYLASQLKMFRDGDRHNDMNQMMRSVAAKLTDNEIDALSKYLGGLH
ncbi:MULTISPECIES: c-type cytochrome [Salinivibrio]|jgi:cytochrome c553|uniref:Cytochrome c4 n=1 Tax=Salinivibrio costicola TaxID=51367 RepID=A0ABX6K6M3_SALCS|nr:MULTISPECIES: c-type cytochrome [Salinivibrio]ODP97739.1 cytochrome C [Salinivibrio sp. DV]OOF09845.1 cytochrome c4 [Salinivibrio sp. PR5]OOF10085.1 cytochrome c4 [Salinivibrio sp. PR919]OOF17019.1 cytochrome c4 [Salinivibrio sp. PR932]OOF22404.1 cytochrome c4 [Salinivibrio sp. IB574]